LRNAFSEKRALRSISRGTGCALLLVCVLQLAMSAAFMRLQGRIDLTGGLWFHLLAVLSSFSVLTGALLGRELLGAEESPVKKTPLRPMEAPALIISGVALCMAANIAGALAEAIAGQAGIEFHGGPEMTAPQSAPGLLLMLLTVAVLPAVTEEWLLRGVILPPLRRFGDGFAVVCSALLFALLHQNMQQAPMAFASGLALGWVYVRGGGRLAIPILVHLWNNAASVALSVMTDRAANLYALALGMLGMLSLAYLCLRRRPSQKTTCELPAGRRAFHFFFGSIAMLLPLAYFVVVIVLNTRVA